MFKITDRPGIAMMQDRDRDRESGGNTMTTKTEKTEKTESTKTKNLARAARASAIAIVAGIAMTLTGCSAPAGDPQRAQYDAAVAESPELAKMPFTEFQTLGAAVCADLEVAPVPSAVIFDYGMQIWTTTSFEPEQAGILLRHVVLAHCSEQMDRLATM